MTELFNGYGEVDGLSILNPHGRYTKKVSREIE